MDKTQVRDAATIIVTRGTGDQTRILMGQRGAKAAFMPSKYVFPGGAVDDSDDVPLGTALPRADLDRLQHKSARSAAVLAAAAIRELWEETGQILGTPGSWTDAPADWAGFAAAGYRPNAGGLHFLFRAVTPAGRPRRFDARFFVVSSDEICTDLDDFSNAEDELSHLHWVGLAEARALDLPFITEIVLAELDRFIKKGPRDATPFLTHDDDGHHVQDVP